MASLVPTIDYTNKDYQSIHEELIELVKAECPDWTDFYESDFGMVIIDLFAYMGDMLNYYQDRIANEMFLSTAKQKESIAKILELIGYKVPLADAATVTLHFTCHPAIAEESKYIPRGTQVKTANGITFETIEGYDVPNNATSADIIAVHGITKSFACGYSNGLPGQIFTLPDTNIIQDTIRITVGTTAEEWSEVDYFVDSAALDNVFLVKQDRYLMFGDGITGRIPIQGSAITAIYRTGGGLNGNVLANTLTSFVGTPPAVVTSVTNPLPAAGGAEAETIERSRIQGPKELKTMWRAVTEEDFETLARAFSSRISKVHAISSPFWFTKVYLAPVAETDGTYTSFTAAELDDIREYLLDRKMLCQDIEVSNGVNIPVNITGIVDILPTYIRSTVRESVNAAIEAAFNTETGEISFGESLYLSNIYALIMGITGVKYTNLTLLGKQGPQGLVATLAATGGHIVHPYALYYGVSAITSGGETMLSTVFHVDTTTGSTNQVTLTWTAYPGATSYRIYRNYNSTDTVSTCAKLDAKELDDAILTWVDDGTEWIGTNSPITVSLSNLVLANDEIPTIGTINLTYTGGATE